jgi:hypothetical protein
MWACGHIHLRHQGHHSTDSTRGADPLPLRDARGEDPPPPIEQPPPHRQPPASAKVRTWVLLKKKNPWAGVGSPSNRVLNKGPEFLVGAAGLAVSALRTTPPQKKQKQKHGCTQYKGIWPASTAPLSRPALVSYKLLYNNYNTASSCAPRPRRPVRPRVRGSAFFAPSWIDIA